MMILMCCKERKKIILDEINEKDCISVTVMGYGFSVSMLEYKFYDDS